MSELIAQIQAAQRDAGERAVIAHLEATMGKLRLTAAQPAPPMGQVLQFSNASQRADWLAKNMPAPMEACACIGPQSGQPLCPCGMRGVVVKDGRYTLPERDLGPAV